VNDAVSENFEESQSEHTSQFTSQHDRPEDEPSEAEGDHSIIEGEGGFFHEGDNISAMGSELPGFVELNGGDASMVDFDDNTSVISMQLNKARRTNTFSKLQNMVGRGIFKRLDNAY
jgi:hypothetical protein